MVNNTQNLMNGYSMNHVNQNNMISPPDFMVNRNQNMNGNMIQNQGYIGHHGQNGSNICRYNPLL